MRSTPRPFLLALLLASVAVAKPTLSAKEFGDLKKDATNAAKKGDLSEVASKLRELGRDDSERAIETISDLGVRIPDMDIYEAARDAIASMQSPEAVAALVAKCGKERNPMVKILLVDAVAARTDAASEEAIGNALGDSSDEVLRAAIQAAKKRKSVRSVEALIALHAKFEKGKEAGGLMLTNVKEALLAITGEQFEKAQDWTNYWEPRKASFRPVTGDKPKKLEGGTGERAKPKFFGSEIRSNRIVFVIDTSGSMEAADPMPANGDPTPGGSRVRMDRAKQQLTQVVDALPADCKFTIVSYNGILFQGGPGGAGQLPPGTPPDGPLPPTIGGHEWAKIFKPRLFPANASTKAEAKQFIAELKANGATFTFNALKLAFEIQEADTIILLSDGVPTEIDRKDGSEMTTDKILEQVGAMNRFRRLRIDAFGFDAASGGAPGAGGGSRGRGFGGGMGALSEFMQKLAEQNGGAYTQIQ